MNHTRLISRTGLVEKRQNVQAFRLVGRASGASFGPGVDRAFREERCPRTGLPLQIYFDDAFGIRGPVYIVLAEDILSHCIASFHAEAQPVLVREFDGFDGSPVQEVELSSMGLWCGWPHSGRALLIQT